MTAQNSEAHFKLTLKKEYTMKNKNITYILIIFIMAWVYNLHKNQQKADQKTHQKTEQNQHAKSQESEEPIRAAAIKTTITAVSDQSSAIQPTTTLNTQSLQKFNDEVKSKISDFFQQIPRVDALRDLTDEDIHGTPTPVFEAGRYLADMRQFFLTTPHGLEVEMDFYLMCANEPEFFDSIRSVCAARASQNFKQLTGKFISPLVFEKHIARLKDKVEL